MYSFHNSTQVRGKLLDTYENIAISQEKRILNWFQTYEQSASPTRVGDSVFKGEAVPITSVRRALSNLERDHSLVRDGQVKGPYGRMEGVYTLPKGQKDLF